MCLNIEFKFIRGYNKTCIYFPFGVNLAQAIPDDFFTSIEGEFADLKP